ncbi:serine O-acetyltransferase [Lacibacterium aquatile]|uniref:Serine acetyltransferase n=1 Tax=Lacibacterium aquatile TaxID=1168082 RepID=A0ABW5DLU6_9PROT
MFFKQFRDDIDGILARDPAARSALEVALCYPGLHAVVIYRASHFLWRHDLKLIARFISNIGRTLTGIEIHPGARVGRRLFIDHGMGVVIGETAEIGDNVTLYQGVTLGGTALEQVKRHPTLEDDVIVGAGAQVLGPFTVGKGARVGANAVVVKPVPAGATVTGIPAKVVGEVSLDQRSFCAYGIGPGELPDPVARGLGGLLDDLEALRDRVAAMEEAQQADEKIVKLPVGDVAKDDRRIGGAA